MSWVRGVVSVDILGDGSMHACTSELEVVEGQKPLTFEDSGADAEVFDCLRRREPGRFETVAYFGGATAILVPFGTLSLLSASEMARLDQKFGFAGMPLVGRQALMMLVRNTGAPAQWNCAEPAGGMASDVDLELEAVKEIVELGVFHDEGWLGFRLAAGSAEHQAALHGEQEEVWGAVNPDLRLTNWTTLHDMSLGQDSLDGRTGIVSAGPVGDLSLCTVKRIGTEPRFSDGWRFLDTELHLGSDGEVIPLRRKVVAVVPRDDKAPVMFELGPDGRLHVGGVHVVLEGENLELLTSVLAKRVLRVLGWVRP